MGDGVMAQVDPYVMLSPAGALYAFAQRQPDEAATQLQTLMPRGAAWRRSSFAEIECKVPSQGMPSATGPTRWATRSFISAAALFVKVIARIADGLTFL